MISTCSKCGQLTPARSQPPDVCARCGAFLRLLEVADALLQWRGTVDVVSGTDAADRLAAIVDQAHLATTAARSL